MPYNTQQQGNTGSFVPTTTILDVSRIAEVDIKSPEFKELLVRLYQSLNNISLVLNTKETGYCLTQEFNTGKLLFNNAPNRNKQTDLRPIFREVVDMGALGANLTTKPHNLPVPTISPYWKMVNIYGAASKNTGPLFYPLPYAGTSTKNIAVFVDGTTVTIDNQSGQTFDHSYILLEYVKY